MRDAVYASLPSTHFLSGETYWLVVASDDQIFIPPSSHRALIKRADDTHVRHLFEPQQTAFVELHAVTAIWPDANHSPDDKGNLKERRVYCAAQMTSVLFFSSSLFCWIWPFHSVKNSQSLGCPCDGTGNFPFLSCFLPCEMPSFLYLHLGNTCFRAFYWQPSGCLAHVYGKTLSV